MLVCNQSAVDINQSVDALLHSHKSFSQSERERERESAWCVVMSGSKKSAAAAGGSARPAAKDGYDALVKVIAGSLRDALGADTASTPPEERAHLAFALLDEAHRDEGRGGVAAAAAAARELFWSAAMTDADRQEILQHCILLVQTELMADMKSFQQSLAEGGALRSLLDLVLSACVRGADKGRREASDEASAAKDTEAGVDGERRALILYRLIDDILQSVSVFECPVLISWIEDNEENLSRCVYPSERQERMVEAVRLKTWMSLVRRLSKSLDMRTCGRVLMILSKETPLTNRGGYNMLGQRNVNNKTVIADDDGGRASALLTAAAEEDEGGEREYRDDDGAGVEGMDVDDGGERKDNENAELAPAKRPQCRIDYELYKTFWGLQSFFSVRSVGCPKMTDLEAQKRSFIEEHWPRARREDWNGSSAEPFLWLFANLDSSSCCFSSVFTLRIIDDCIRRSQSERLPRRSLLISTRRCVAWWRCLGTYPFRSRRAPTRARSMSGCSRRST